MKSLIAQWAALPIWLGAAIAVLVMFFIEDPSQRKAYVLITLLTALALESAIIFPLVLHLKLRSAKKDELEETLEEGCEPSIWEQANMGTADRMILAFLIAAPAFALLGWGEAQTVFFFGEGFDGSWREAVEMDEAFDESNSWFRFTRTPIGILCRLLGAGFFYLAMWVMPERQKK